MSEYCLRWNNHRPNLVTVFSELLTSEALVDVTLATDGHYIHAHKLVLSACSVYFKDLFGANPCKHPIVILKDIRIDDLKTVIDFIYRGEVNVAQDRLQDVLKTAESLRIKGLAENPRNYDELSSHGQRFSSLGSQVTRQRSSLTDSREQSLSLEGEEDGEPGTPPSSKRRKINLSHDSSESQHDEQENDTNRVSEVKDEPVDDRENDKSHSGETVIEQDANVNRVADAMLMLQGTSQESGEDSSITAGTSTENTLTTSHTQGSMCRWGAGEPPSLESLLAGPYTPPGPPTPASSPPPPPPTLPSSQSLTPSSSTLVSYPMHPPPGPSSYHTPKGWPPQFRRMSPNMLMAIEAVRTGKMGFTQAGKTYGVNGRTLWVYYRKLGYEVHNTFRGKKHKGYEAPQSIAMNYIPNVECAGSSSSREEEISHMEDITIPVVTVVEEDDDEIIVPPDTNDRLLEVPLGEGQPHPANEEESYSTPPQQPAPNPPQNTEVLGDEASRTLQTLLDSFNLKNVWTTPV